MAKTTPDAEPPPEAPKAHRNLVRGTENKQGSGFRGNEKKHVPLEFPQTGKFRFPKPSSSHGGPLKNFLQIFQGPHTRRPPLTSRLDLCVLRLPEYWTEGMVGNSGLLRFRPFGVLGSKRCFGFRGSVGSCKWFVMGGLKSVKD